MLSKDSKIYIAGHHGLVGSAIWNNLKKRGYNNLVGRSHKELDLTDQYAVEKFFDEEKPDAVVLAAAFVGGIMANSLYRADFIMQNMKMQCNVISNAYSHGVKKLLFLGSTCIYPKNAPQPMSEDVLLTSPLEYTNEEYAIAKIAGLKMCESYNLQYGTNYIAVMPTNLYGPNDNFHLENSHVMPAMMRKIYLAKLIHDGDWHSIEVDMNKRPINPTDKLREIIGEGNVDGNNPHERILKALEFYGIYDNKVVLWGTGKPLREFAQLAFHYVGIELKWEGKEENEKGICVEGSEELIGKTLVEVSPDFYRPTDVVNLWGDPTKAKAKLNWNPNSTSFEDLVKIMVESDMAKVAAEDAGEKVLCNLVEYLEKGIVK